MGLGIGFAGDWPCDRPCGQTSKVGAALNGEDSLSGLRMSRFIALRNSNIIDTPPSSNCGSPVKARCSKCRKPR